MKRRPLRYVISAVLVSLALTWPITAFAAGGQWAEGRLTVAHGHNFETGQEYWDYQLATDQGRVQLDFGGQGPQGFLNGAVVRVHGYYRNPQVMAVANNGAEAQVLASAQAIAAPTTKRIALLLVNFLTNPLEPWTQATAAERMFTNPNSVANYFGEESYGNATVTGDVYGYYTIDYNTSACNYTDLATKAKQAATAAGVTLSNYTNIEYAFPTVGACGWSGLAYLPGTESWLNNALSLRVSSHELSHNFGIHHASTINCVENGVRVSLSVNTANCTYAEYGDPFTVMGSAQTRHTHAQQLVQLGWIGTGETQTVTVGGTYTLGATEDPTSSPKALRVARGNGTYLYLDLREPWGTEFDNFSTSDPAVTGVTLRISGDWGTIVQSKLIDTTPLTTSFTDAPLQVGAGFTDPVSGVTVSVLSVVAGVATVDLSWGADSIPPSAPTNVNASSTGTRTATVSWTASTDNVGVASYEVSRDGVVRGTSTTTSFADSGLVDGQTYLYSVIAFDAAGNSSSAGTKTWTKPIPDTTAPTTPTSFRTTSVTRSKISLAWNAATDNVGVAGYRIYRNGALWATTSGLSYTGTRSNKVYTYTIVAYDAAGNVSAASAGVTR